jgi:ABC-2 type transport system ATP-binding protein
MPEHDCLPTDVSATEFVAHMAGVSGLPRSAARERTADALRHVGLFEERYREMGGYSMGMKQRVKLAQALVHDPRVLLLDEPTNGLDPEARDDMLDLVRRIGRDFGIAIIMASHLLTEIERVCNYLVVIDAGRLVRSGAVASFTERTQVLVVEVEGDSAALAQRLRDDGLTLRQEDGRILVGLEGERTYDLIRDAIADLGLALLCLEQARQSLEDLFRTPKADADDVALN